MNESGETLPWTTSSPRPYDDEMWMTPRWPESGSSVNMTPDVARSERTIFMMTTDSALASGSRRFLIW